MRVPTPPLDPVRIVEKIPGVRQAGTPQKLDDLPVIVREAEDLSTHGDPPTAGGRRPMHDDGRRHASKVLPIRSDRSRATAEADQAHVQLDRMATGNTPARPRTSRLRHVL